MSLQQKYKKSLTEKRSLRFKTKHPDGDNYDGIVTHIKPGFIALREERDFEFDGVIVLQRKFIKGTRDGKVERCFNEILRANGAMKKLRVPLWLDSCETIQEVVSALMDHNIWPGIEIVFNKGADSAFYLGPITRVDEDRFFLRCYDAAGKWEKNYELSYKQIFRIEFDSKYCDYFNAYMRSKTGKK